MANTIDIIGDNALIDQIIAKAITEIEDDTISSVGYNAFANNNNLTSVKLTAATIIDRLAFNTCTHLASVELPAATSIGDNAFGGCYALASLEIPAATSIGTSAFSYCVKLASIKLPAVTSIARSFPDCYALTDIYVSAKEGEISGAPWGATNATIHYNYDFSQDGGE